MTASTTFRPDLADQSTQPLVSPSQEHTPVPLGAQHLLLLLPNEEGTLQASAMENFFQACATDDAFCLELTGTPYAQGFFLRATCAEQLTLLSQQLAAQYPQAELQRVAPTADPLLLHAGEQAVIGEFSLTGSSFLPLKTFSGKALAEPGADPLAGILAAMEPLTPGQRLVAQLSLARAPHHWMAPHLRKSVEHPLQHERDAASRARARPSTTHEDTKTLLFVGGLFALLLLSRWHTFHLWFPPIWLLVALVALGMGFLLWKLTHHTQAIYDMKLVAEKLSRQAFFCQLRVIAIGPIATSTRAQLQGHVRRLEVAYRQFTLSSSNGLSLKRIQVLQAETTTITRLSSPGQAFPYRHRLLRLLHGGALGPDVWNGLELAGAFHLPQACTDLPLVRRLSVKHLLASPELARQIERTPAPLPPALIGASRHRGYAVPVYVPYPTLFSHQFLIARSRYGKSTLIQLLVHAAMQPVCDQTPQPGIFVIDPHRDLIEDLLLLVPPDRASDVVLLDLTDTQYPIALNPLDASMGFTRDQAVANLLSSFERVWSDFWGPRMAYFLKAVCLLLYTLNQQKVQQGKADQQYTLLDINPLLQYPDYALQVLAELDQSETWHQELYAWWQHVYFALPRQSSFRNEVIMPIVSKLGLFQDNQQLRRIVGQPVTNAPVQVSITEGKIVLCALSSRNMDDASVNVLGSTLLNLLHRAFRLQEPLPLLERRKVFCAVDEFQAFAGGDYDRLLSEDGKFGCSLLLATQSLKRLNKIRDGLLEMVFSTCDNLCAFNVSAADAKLLEDEFRKVVEQRHMLSQPRLHCYARLAIPGAPVQIVSVALASPPSWQHDPARVQLAEQIRTRNQRQNQHRDAIDRRYGEHIQQFLDVGPFAQKVQRDAQRASQHKHEREDAEQLATIYEQHHHQMKGATSMIQQHQPRQDSGGTPATIGSNLAGGSSRHNPPSAHAEDTPSAGTEQVSQEEHDDKRNHPRSKRKKHPKDPVGVPPPPPGTMTEADEARALLPLRGLGAGSFWSYERERGE